jgi:hypothetical protein
MAKQVVEKMILGAALSVAASALLPIARETFPLFIKTGRKGVGELIQRTKASVQIAREEIEDIVAEAQFERMKRKFDAEIFSEE